MKTRFVHMKRCARCYGLVIMLCLYSASVQAATTDTYAWGAVLKSIAGAITGPVAYFMSIIVIAIACLILAFGDLQGGAKRLVQAMVGCGIAFTSVQVVTGFLHFHGAII